jgi:hypothetical protein
VDDRRSMRAEAAAEKARLKAMRPWYRKKRFIIPLVLVAIILIAAVAGGGGGDDGGNGGSTEESKRFPDRADVKRNDKERNVGESADLSGFTVTVTQAGFRQELSPFEANGYLVADATLLNRDDRAQAYNPFHWKLITPQGQIIDPCFCGRQLGSGDLAQNGTISGQLIWEIGGQKGDFYVVFDPPDVADDARGVWKVTL